MSRPDNFTTRSREKPCNRAVEEKDNQKAERLELVVSLKGGQSSFKNEVVTEQPVGHGLGLLLRKNTRTWVLIVPELRQLEFINIVVEHMVVAQKREKGSIDTGDDSPSAGEK
jgi:hypothetical protein